MHNQSPPHQPHDRLTEGFERINQETGRWIKIVLIAAGLTAFLVWISMQLGWQRSPLHPMTFLLFVLSCYIIYKIKSMY